MTRQLAVLVAVAVVVACSAGGGHGAHTAASPTNQRAQSYDVAAARLCKSFDTLINDAQKGATEVDSQALVVAMKGVMANYGPRRRWRSLTVDVGTFLEDAANSTGNLKADGLKVGHDCLGIPLVAQKAAGV
jgi:hypothetical protein